MADKTGRSLGTLDPVVYFHNSSLTVFKVDRFVTIHLPHGHYLMPPIGVGEGPQLARRLFEEKFKPNGYQWCEADTLSEVDTLQNRLVEQETLIMKAQGGRLDDIRTRARRETSSNLRQRMSSSDCSQYERDFIQLWLDMDEDKRKKYTQRFTERNMYLWSREMGSQTKVEDRMGEG